MRKISVFDVCGTLYTVNTTFDFIQFYHKSRSNYFRWFLVKLLQSKIGKLFNKIFGFSIRRYIIFSLRGELAFDVGYIAQIYVSSELSKRQCSLAFDYLNYCKSDSNVEDVFLISASIEPVIQKVAQELNVSYLCSKLELKDGKYTGKLTTDLKGNKTKFIKDAEVVFFASDNHDDFDLGLIASRYVIFTKRKNYSYWKEKIEGVEHEGINIEFV